MTGNLFIHNLITENMVLHLINQENEMKTKKVLKKVFMVGFSSCPFGEETIQEVSLFGELKCCLHINQI